MALKSSSQTKGETSRSRSQIKQREGNDPDAASKPNAGIYIVATPIGNLGDLTLRARDLLGRVDLIACEDTRVTQKLLAGHGLTASLTAYHDHNAAKVRPQIIEQVKSGKSVALLSDAGTPLVSDPGLKLVQAAQDAGLYVTALPGASAILTALVLSGLPCNAFLFAGFLPNKRTARRKALAQWQETPATLVFFESPQRLSATLEDAHHILGNRDAVVARELTKRYEELRRGTLESLLESYEGQARPKGEVVLLLGPPGPDTQDKAAALDDCLRQALQDLRTRDAATKVAADLGLPRREVYARALVLAAKPEREETDGDDGRGDQDT